MYDVAIIGAGVAGCAAALSLPAGTRGLLVERSPAGSERCCGGLLAPDAQRALMLLHLAVPDEVRVQPEPQTVRVHDMDSRRWQSYRREYINVDRRRFDSWLLGLAAERVEVRHQTRFVGIGDGGLLLRSGDQTMTVGAKTVIGADGANSGVRRQYFPARPGPPLMLALQARFADRAVLPAHVVLFASALTDFYAWAIPKGSYVLVGSAFHDKHGARERFERVLDWYRDELGLEAEPEGRSGRYLSQPLARSHLLAGAGNVLLAGEAAGLVSPSSGEGISFALLSGAAAGRATSAPEPVWTYAKTFAVLSRRIMVKTVKARVIYAPAARTWALRLPWCP